MVNYYSKLRNKVTFMYGFTEGVAIYPGEGTLTAEEWAIIENHESVIANIASGVWTFTPVEPEPAPAATTTSKTTTSKS